MFIKVPNSERDENGEPLQGSVGGSSSGQGASLFIAYGDTFDLESEPTAVCSLMAKITTCEVHYGVNTCETALREVAVPCYW